MIGMSDYIKKHNWFFLSLICFVCIIPFSEALVSIFAGVMLFASFAGNSSANLVAQFKKNRFLLALPAIYLIYLISALTSGNFSNSLYDLKKNLFFIVIPVAFIFGKEISGYQKRLLFYIFTAAVFISTLVAYVNWIIHSGEGGFDVRDISLISHIRFSFQILLAFWFCILLSYKNHSLNHTYSVTFLIIALYFFLFLVFQHSLTGIIVLIISALYFVVYAVYQSKRGSAKYLLIIVLLVIVVPVLYVGRIVTGFYAAEKISPGSLELKTKQGNYYRHDINNPLIENGKYVYLYVCEEEVREEWNKISEFKYDSIGKNGFPVHSALLRYMTSKGLRKDAGGVRQLTEDDIENVENGIANIIFCNKKYSLYPRIYQTIWEFYVYTKTGYANGQSFSQRIEYAGAAVSIIKQNFWFGVGTGNWKKEFRKAYISGKSKLDESRYASSHNQYLNYMVKFGITGFIIIMSLLIYPVIYKRRYKDILFMLFILLIFFANFADSNLETHMGSSFFLFFYSLFLITGDDGYLELK
ncbi:MAG: O-antigen ligase family protein [Prolixibacteraceae bacterium]|nr:O-antigen ligase family protein [Prolixibacteraceae bacterium]